MKTIATNNRHRAAADPMEALMDDIASIRRDIAALIGGRVDAAGETARQTLARAGESAQAVMSGVTRRATRAHDGLRQVASERPLSTIAVAAAAGIIGYSLLSWMKRR